MDCIKESDEYGDILQAEFADTYTNLTLKSLFALKYLLADDLASRRGVRFVMKVDDDCFVNLRALLAAFKTTSDKLDKKKERSSLFIMGHVFGTDNRTIVPFRTGNSDGSRSSSPKWTVPHYMFAGSEYPQMVSGAGYAMSAETAACIYKSAFNYPFFHLEDVLLTGRRLGLCRTAHINNGIF